MLRSRALNAPGSGWNFRNEIERDPARRGVHGCVSIVAGIALVPSDDAAVLTDEEHANRKCVISPNREGVGHFKRHVPATQFWSQEAW
jgi:hypothetical protein